MIIYTSILILIFNFNHNIVMPHSFFKKKKTCCTMMYDELSNYLFITCAKSLDKAHKA